VPTLAIYSQFIALLFHSQSKKYEDERERERENHQKQCDSSSSLFEASVPPHTRSHVMTQGNFHFHSSGAFYCVQMNVIFALFYFFIFSFSFR
jgi:hypothetical protein